MYQSLRWATAFRRFLLRHGNNHLGGDDFDQRIIDWLADEFKKEQGVDLRNDKMAMQRLKEAAEKAKIELSGVYHLSASSLPFITADATGPKHLETTLTRAKFNELTADLVEATHGSRSSGSFATRVLQRPTSIRYFLSAVLPEFRQFRKL